MNLNQKLKCLLSAVLALVMLMSAMLTAPVTAAEKDTQENAGKAPAAQAVTEDNTVLPNSQAELEELDETEAEAETAATTPDDIVSEEALPENEAEEAAPARKTAEVAETGASPSLQTDLKPYRYRRYNTLIVLKWKKLSIAEGYRIYWRDLTKKNAPIKLLTTVKKNTVTISKLKRGAKYRFYLRPYITKNGKIKEGNGSKPFNAATVPSPVKKFKMKSCGQKAIVLTWKRTANIDGYLILRQHQGTWKAYKYLGARAIRFTDTDVTPGHAYFYKIMTYRKDSRGYLKSSTSLVKTVCGLSGPSNNNSSSRANKITFSWKKNYFASGYMLSYSTNGKTYKSIGKTTNTSYTTVKLKTGAKAYLKVTPYRVLGKNKTMVTGMTSRFVMKATANKYSASVGSTFIEIDLSDQHMWYYVNDEVYVSTPVVTGNYDSMDTPTGIFSINNMSRSVSLVGADYVSYVEYWMCFIGTSYGIHDASWRDSFGGDIFKGNGSHGCVNTPYDAVQKIYNRATVGTPVVIHW